MLRAHNQAQWYPAERGSSRQATVAAGVDFVAEETREGWQLSFWSEHEGKMESVQHTFRSFGELRDHVDLSAPEYARFNRQARVRHGRAVNPEEDGIEELKRRLTA